MKRRLKTHRQKLANPAEQARGSYATALRIPSNGRRVIKKPLEGDYQNRYYQD